MENLKVDLATLLRMFAVQEIPYLMFFLGAGASARSGIPTAAEMVWLFKRAIYCTETGADPQAFRDLSVEKYRQYLQAYFDNKGGLPPRGADSEYSIYFDRCYPDPEVRRSFIRQLIRQGKPTIGHECLAVLLAEGRCHWVWGTNFDDLVERAERPDAAHRLCEVSPESGRRLSKMVEDNASPVLVKLHGDYRYDKLQNTEEELKSLDDELRKYLLQICKENGLIVVGYSGRDESVMSSLESAASEGDLRKGLYWCVREGDLIAERVQNLMGKVIQQGGRGGFVEIASFDEFLFQIYRQSSLKDSEIDRKAEALFEQRRPFTIVTKKDPRNVLKLTALKIVDYRTTPYRFRRSIESWRELRETVGPHPIIAGLLSGCVLAFGRRELIQSVFEGKITDTVETADVQPQDLYRSDSVTMGLLYDIIERSLVDQYKLLKAERRTVYIPDPGRSQGKRVFQFQWRRENHAIAVATDVGKVVVNEAFTYQLGFHENSLWFVLEPRVIVTEDGTSLAQIDMRREVANRVISVRYNKEAHTRLLFWLNYLCRVTNPISFVFPSYEDVVVRMTLDSHYAFSSLKGV